jgi:hypothetical protein
MAQAQKAPGPSPTEIQSVLSALRILTRWELDQYPLPEAVAHLRASYGLRRRGLRDYVLAVMGNIAYSPTREFRLFCKTDGQTEIPVPEEQKGKRLVDYLAENFDQRNLPARIEHGDRARFFL